MIQDLRILILEDVPTDAELIERKLVREGLEFSSTCVDTKPAFIEALDHFQPHVILADYRLPGFDGMKALEIAKEKVPDVPFIFVSGALGEEVAIDTLTAGATDYVLKHRLNRLPPAVLRAVSDYEKRRQLKKAQRKLHRSEEKYRMLVESANSIILRRTVNGNITYINTFGLEFFGYTEEELVGRNIVGTIVPDTDETGKNLAEMIRQISDKPEKYVNNENENMRKNGERVWVNWTNKAIRDKHGRVRELLCIGNDITEQKRMSRELLKQKDQLQALATELSLAEERERRRLAEDLHDEIGQKMALMRIKLGMIGEYLDGEQGREFYLELRELFRETVSGIRKLSFEMSTPILYELGLKDALEWITEQYQNKNRFKAEFTAEGDFSGIDEVIGILVFRSVGELLNNVALHADAEHVTVEVVAEEEELRVRVTDDGIGFDPEDLSGTRRFEVFGLFSIRERMHHLRGGFELNTAPGKGTSVELSVPKANTAVFP